MPNTEDTIERLVKRAEECRVLAGIVEDAEAADSYLKLADAYELLAEQERTLLVVRQNAKVAAGPTSFAGSASPTSVTGE